MADISALTGLTQNSAGDTSLAAIKTAVGNVNDSIGAGIDLTNVELLESADKQTWYVGGGNIDEPSFIFSAFGTEASPREDGGVILGLQDHYKALTLGRFGTPQSSYQFEGYFLPGSTSGYTVLDVRGFNETGGSYNFHGIHVATAYNGTFSTPGFNTSLWVQASDGNVANVAYSGIEINTDNLVGNEGPSWWVSPRKAGLQIVDGAGTGLPNGEPFYLSTVGCLINGYTTSVGIYGFSDVGIHIYTPYTAGVGTGIKMDQNIYTGIDLHSGTFVGEAINATGQMIRTGWLNTVNVGAAGTPSGGGYIYSKSGALYYKGSSGTETKIANA